MRGRRLIGERLLAAFERAGDGRVVLPARALSRLAPSFVRSLALFGGGGSFTPARRAFDRPMAIACFAERAPCLPSRMCSISSRTNAPAWVDGDLPSRFALRASAMVFFSGIGSSRDERVAILVLVHGTQGPAHIALAFVRTLRHDRRP